MINFEKALKLVLSSVNTLGVENICSRDAAGRVLSRNIFSDMDIPPFDKSAMDGYAVRAADLMTVPTELVVIEEIMAGKFPKKHIKNGECAGIMTGGAVPAGADSVVIVEDTKSISDTNKILVKKKAKKYANICFRGEDIKKRTLVLKKRKLLGHSDIALLISLGQYRVEVFKKPRVAVFATGDELIEEKETLRPGKIRNSNSPMLISLLKSLGIEVDDLGIAGDNFKELKKKIREGLKRDILILSGGVSMGDYDLVPVTLKKAGVREIFHKVAIKPGKPLFFGKKGRKIIFGTPGNPVSTLITFMLFIKLSILKIIGQPDSKLNILTGIIREPFRKKVGRKSFYPVKIEFLGGNYYISPVEFHGSADIGAITHADGFMIIESEVIEVKKGETIQFIKL